MHEKKGTSIPQFDTQLEWALHLRRMGFTVLPILAGTKKPAAKWDVWENDQSEDHIRAHWAEHPDHEGSFILNDRLVIFDADTPQAIQALRELESKHGMVPLGIVETQKGLHHYYRRPAGVDARQDSHSTTEHPERLDVKTGHSLVMAPGSTGKVIRRWNFTHVDGLNPVTQEFINDIERLNQRSPSSGTTSCTDTGRTPPVGDEGLPKLGTLIDHIAPEGYGDWCKVGMALHRETGGSTAGLALFDEWSSRGSSYKGPSDVEAKWRTFDKPVENPVTIGTLVHMAREAGADLDTILHGGRDEFQVVETVTCPAEDSVEPAATKVNPLLKYSLRDLLPELEKEAVDQVLILGSLMIHGQAGVVYAEPGTGKTLLVLHLLMQDINNGRLDPTKVYYLNMDDNSSGLVEKIRLAQEYGFHMLAEGHQGFTSSMFVRHMEEMTEDGTARGCVVVLDTLTKCVDTMSKSDTRLFNGKIRRFVGKGGTVLALAHTNKNKGLNGKVVYAGTADVRNDFDCCYTLAALSDGGTVKTIEFENIKRRGNVKAKAFYSYAIEDGLSYEALLSSVEEVDPERAVGLKRTAELKSHAELIEVVSSCIGEGINSKMKLAEEVSARTTCSRSRALELLEKYTGDCPDEHRWNFRVVARGAKVYEVLAPRETPEPAPGDLARSPGFQVPRSTPPGAPDPGFGASL